MKKYLGLIFIALSASTILSTAVFADEGDSCSITVYEKTPDCFVTKDGSGCITITNSKPKCNKKGQCTIAVPGCTTKKEY